MKIIIDIPEMIYKGAVAGNRSSIIGIKLSQAVRNGTVLPRGHGRLIDADETLKRHCNELCRHKPHCEDDCIFYDVFHLAKTIVAADTEVEE